MKSGGRNSKQQAGGRSIALPRYSYFLQSRKLRILKARCRCYLPIVTERINVKNC